MNTVPMVKAAGTSLFDALRFPNGADTVDRMTRAEFIAEMICPVNRWALSNDIIALVQVCERDANDALNSCYNDAESKTLTETRDKLKKWLLDNNLYTVSK